MKIFDSVCEYYQTIEQRTGLCVSDLPLHTWRSFVTQDA